MRPAIEQQAWPLAEFSAWREPRLLLEAVSIPMRSCKSLGERCAWVLGLGLLGACNDGDPQLPVGSAGGSADIAHGGSSAIDADMASGGTAAETAGAAGSAGVAGSAGNEPQPMGGTSAGNAGSGGNGGAGVAGSAGVGPEPLVGPRWVVYRSTESYVNSLRAVDVASNIMPSVMIGGDPGVDLPVSDYAFSPDGKFLAYLASKDKDTVSPNLWLMDMSGPLLGRSVLVKTPGIVRRFAWSPDSKTLAFVGVDEAKKNRVFYVDMNGAAPEAQGPIASTNPSMKLLWASNTVLVMYSTGSSYVRRGPAGFSSVQLLSHSGLSVGAYQSLETLLFINNQAGACGGSWTLLNLATQTPDTYMGATAFSAGLTYAATWSATRIGYVLAPVANRTQEKLVSITPEAYACIGAWSHAGSLFAWANDLNRLAIVDAAAAETKPTVVTGAYTALTGSSQLKFSPNDRFVAFVDKFGELFITEIESGVPGNAQRITPNLADDGKSVQYLAFSPDSRFLAYSAPQTSAGKEDVFLVDLSSGEPTPRKIPDSGNTANSISMLWWSKDSAFLLFAESSVLRDGAKVSDRLKVVNVRRAPNETAATQINNPAHCVADAKACSTVQSARIQP